MGVKSVKGELWDPRLTVGRATPPPLERPGVEPEERSESNLSSRLRKQLQQDGC